MHGVTTIDVLFVDVEILELERTGLTRMMDVVHFESCFRAHVYRLLRLCVPFRVAITNLLVEYKLMIKFTLDYSVCTAKVSQTQKSYLS